MSGYEVIADGGRRRFWSAAEKLRIVEETLDGRASISVVARRNGVSAKARYSKHYRISAEQLTWLGQHVEELGRAVLAICTERIAQLEATAREAG